MAKLDKKKPYFSVHGEESGAVFEQEGRLFDLDENEIIDEPDNTDDVSGKPAAPAAKTVTNPKGKGKAAKTVPVPPAKVEAPSVVDQQLAAQGVD